MVLCNKDSVSIWNIPPLYPCGSTLASTIQALAPSQYFPLSLGMNPSIPEYNVEILHDWYNGSDQPVYVDFLFSLDNLTIEVSRFRLDLPSSVIKLRTGLQSPSLHKMAYLTIPADDGYLEEYRVSNGNIFMYWSSDRGMNIQSTPFQFSNVSPADNVETSQLLLSWHESPSIARFLTSLCPASGRMCCVPQNNFIRIVDFLSPPSAGELSELFVRYLR